MWQSFEENVNDCNHCQDKNPVQFNVSKKQQSDHFEIHQHSCSAPSTSKGSYGKQSDLLDDYNCAQIM